MKHLRGNVVHQLHQQSASISYIINCENCAISIPEWFFFFIFFPSSCYTLQIDQLFDSINWTSNMHLIRWYITINCLQLEFDHLGCKALFLRWFFFNTFSLNFVHFVSCIRFQFGWKLETKWMHRNCMQCDDRV